MDPQSGRQGMGRGPCQFPGSAVGWVATASVVAAAALGGCGAARVAPVPTTAPPRRAAEPPASPRPSRGSWLIAPDAPMPRDSRWWTVLAVARRFATADMSYELGELGPTVRRAFARTCTAAFAAELLAHRPILPPGVSPQQVREHLVGVQPLERLPDAAVVLATVEPNRRGGLAGALELRLVSRSGAWRVSAMTIA